MRTGNERANLYAEVTARVIVELEEGRLAWVQPWDPAACGCTMPANAVTGRRYSGINVLIPWAAVEGPVQGLYGVRPTELCLSPDIVDVQCCGTGGLIQSVERADFRTPSGSIALKRQAWLGISLAVVAAWRLRGIIRLLVRPGFSAQMPSRSSCCSIKFRMA